MRWLAIVVALLVCPSAAFAACEGQDWRDALAPETLREIRARAAAVPYHEGIAFEAVRGETRLTLFGTVHLTDPRVFVPDEIAARIRAADLLLVEVTQDLFADFERKLAADPMLLFDVEGPGLKSRLAAHEWETLQGAFSAMGVEPDRGDRMRPWFVSLLLELPPCETAAVAAGTRVLDARIEALARDAGVAVSSLDAAPEELLSFFTDMTEEEGLDVLRLSLAAYAEDGSSIVTVVGAWVDEEILVSWEVVRARAAALSGNTASVDYWLDRAYEILVEERNRDWLVTILRLSRDAPRTVIAVGALHLPGEGGLLRLLEREGFAIRRLRVF